MIYKNLNILHISDVHFSLDSKTKSSQKKITNALVDAVKNYDKQLDFCVFTGDLANKALIEEYCFAEQWLEDIFHAINNKSAKMIICPGNHDVDRNQASRVSFRGAARNESLLNDFLNEPKNERQHLKQFFDWHSNFKRKNKWVISSWDNDVNHVFSDCKDIPINFIMANSAILSCDNEDRGNLCINIPQLNDCLDKCREKPGINICLMHHPSEGNWLAQWNQDEINLLLSQKSGCHFLLSGHVHDMEGHSYANNYGQNLIRFQCGSAHSDGDWKKEFSILEIDIDSSHVTPNNYVYSKRSGEWTKNNDQSHPISIIPLNIPVTEKAKKKN